MLSEESGQSTVEYAIVFLAFTAMLVALGLVWATGHDGAFVDGAEAAASHRVELGLPSIVGTVQDIFLY